MEFQENKGYEWSPRKISLMVVFHLAAIIALWFYTWQGLVIAIAMYIIAGFGVAIGFHRLITHKSFETFRWVRWILAFIGSLSGSYDPVYWVAVHRLHHQNTDDDNDFHSPKSKRRGFWGSLAGFLWAHMGCWMIKLKNEEELCNRFAPDLLKDPVIVRIRYWSIPFQIMLGLMLGIIGWLCGGFTMALSLVLWVMFLRIIVFFHFSSSINSVCHLWGYRNYDTDDQSTNNPLLAPFTFGEWPHNNHHYLQNVANYGRLWWEKLLDFSYLVILVLKQLGLAWNVKYEPAPTKS